MNISPKRKEQIDQAAWGLPWFKTVEKLYTADHPGMMNTDDFLTWLTTDPTPAPPTIDDLSDEDRLGYVLVKTFMSPRIADTIYLQRKEDFPGQIEIWNARAAAVAAEARHQIERDFILVPRERDEDADAELYRETNENHDSWINHGDPDNDPSEAIKAGIAAVLAKYAEGEAKP